MYLGPIQKKMLAVLLDEGSLSVMELTQRARVLRCQALGVCQCACTKRCLDSGAYYDYQSITMLRAYGLLQVAPVPPGERKCAWFGITAKGIEQALALECVAPAADA